MFFYSQKISWTFTKKMAYDNQWFDFGDDVLEAVAGRAEWLNDFEVQPADLGHCIEVSESGMTYNYKEMESVFEGLYRNENVERVPDDSVIGGPNVSGETNKPIEATPANIVKAIIGEKINDELVVQYGGGNAVQVVSNMDKSNFNEPNFVENLDTTNDWISRRYTGHPNGNYELNESHVTGQYNRQDGQGMQYGRLGDDDVNPEDPSERYMSQHLLFRVIEVNELYYQKFHMQGACYKLQIERPNPDEDPEAWLVQLFE